MLKPGEIVNGKYRIEALIGEGGMGAVYAARHLELGTPVALKFLHRDVGANRVVAQRFLQEARISAQIRSPYVTRVTDVDTTAQGGAYIVMERLEGESLQSLLDREGKLDLDVALDLGIQILVGVEAAHAIGVVHRDLKPDNIFLVETPGGPHVKLLDFGIAKARQEGAGKDSLTQPGSFMGTPEYMAPEQAFSADTASPRSDIFAVGVLLYRMISGRLPAEGTDPLAVASKHASGDAPRLNRLNPTIPDVLATLVHNAMSPSPERRPVDARTLRQALMPFASRLSHPGRIAAEPIDGVGAFSVATTAGGTVPVKQVPVPSESNTRPERQAQLTGAATPPPSPPSAVETRASGKGDTEKVKVVTTIPPPDGPPPATAPPKNLSASKATQDMPQAGARNATEQMTASPPEVSTAMDPKSPTQRNPAPESGGSNAWIWILLVLFVAGGAAAGGFIYVQQTDIGPPPPLPTVPATSPGAAAPALPTTVPTPQGATPAAPAPRAASPSPATASPTPGAAAPPPGAAAPAPAATSTATATAAAATATVPTSVPTTLPPGLPSSLPAGLPTAIPTAIPTTLPPLPTAIPTAAPTAPPPQ